MNSIIVGLGTQGKKRKNILGRKLVGTVDTLNPEADAQCIEEIDVKTYDAIFCCVPDEAKMEIIQSALDLKKNILVEKPLILQDINHFRELQIECNKKGIYLQSAYNHRYEPNLMKAKELIDKKDIGEIYSLRCFYGNGTAALVAKSNWRNRSHGVGVDLGSHMLDLLLFYFGEQEYSLKSQTWNIETFCPDRALIFGDYGHVSVVLEASYLSWKNVFSLEIWGDKGTIIVQGLCKWGESTIEIHYRTFPSGEPNITKQVVAKGDTTWSEEIRLFHQSSVMGLATNLKRDEIIQKILKDSSLIQKRQPE
jgi:scyllo-inositol 2-dehydrogenase (NADP+)